MVPGFIWSQNDGDRHWISADKLIHLYGLKPGEYRVARDYWDSLNYVDELIRLHPLFNGQYKKPI